MKDFITGIFNSENFPIYLGCIIVALIVAFVVVFLLGKKDKKEHAKEENNDNNMNSSGAFKEITTGQKMEIPSMENNQGNLGGNMNMYNNQPGQMMPNFNQMNPNMGMQNPMNNQAFSQVNSGRGQMGIGMGQNMQPNSYNNFIQKPNQNPNYEQNNMAKQNTQPMQNQYFYGGFTGYGSAPKITPVNEVPNEKIPLVENPGIPPINMPTNEENITTIDEIRTNNFAYNQEPKNNFNKFISERVMTPTNDLVIKDTSDSLLEENDKNDDLSSIYKFSKEPNPINFKGLTESIEKDLDEMEKCYMPKNHPPKKTEIFSSVYVPQKEIIGDDNEVIELPRLKDEPLLKDNTDDDIII